MTTGSRSTCGMSRRRNCPTSTTSFTRKVVTIRPMSSQTNSPLILWNGPEACEAGVAAVEIAPTGWTETKVPIAPQHHAVPAHRSIDVVPTVHRHQSWHQADLAPLPPQLQPRSQILAGCSQLSECARLSGG